MVDGSTSLEVSNGEVFLPTSNSYVSILELKACRKEERDRRRSFYHAPWDGSSTRLVMSNFQEHAFT